MLPFLFIFFLLHLLLLLLFPVVVTEFLTVEPSRPALIFFSLFRFWEPSFTEFLINFLFYEIVAWRVPFFYRVFFSVFLLVDGRMFSLMFTGRCSRYRVFFGSFFRCCCCCCCFCCFYRVSLSCGRIGISRRLDEFSFGFSDTLMKLSTTPALSSSPWTCSCLFAGRFSALPSCFTGFSRPIRVGDRAPIAEIHFIGFLFFFGDEAISGRMASVNCFTAQFLIEFGEKNKQIQSPTVHRIGFLLFFLPSFTEFYVLVISCP